MSPTPLTAAATGRPRRWLTLALLLALVVVALPDSAPRQADYTLLRVEHAQAVERPQRLVWLLALGSDARRGQSVSHSRADSIHVVGVDTRTGSGVVLGIPRDSYVDIPGHGRNKINASMVFGGPALTARTVERLVGIRLDYTLLTDFSGFAAMVHQLGGIRVRPPRPMEGLGHSYPPHLQRMNGGKALSFSRVRYGLPRGDFDRSLNQGRVLKAGLRRAEVLSRRPGSFERLMLAAVSRMQTDASPADLYRLGRTMLTVRPQKVDNCVAVGGTGSAGGASVVFLDRASLRRVVRDVRPDARLDHGC